MADQSEDRLDQMEQTNGKAHAEPTQQQNAPAQKKNEYGPGCKNQGASIMSGGCVN